MGTGSGDRLARGQAKAQFPPAEGVSQSRWDDIFAGFDPEAYLKKTFGVPKKKAEE